MIIPLSFFLFWLIKTQNLDREKEKLLGKYLLFYFVWLISLILSGMLYGYSFAFLLGKLGFSSIGLINSFVFLFLISDYSIIKFKNKINFIKKEKHRILYSILLTIFIGLLILILSGKGTGLFSEVFTRLLNPFGGGRTSLTVAENKQPFLNDWIGQTGKVFFWLFFGGLISLGINTSKYIGKHKNKFLFVLFWILMVSGILFSRISSASMFNGDNFISKLFYFGSVAIFVIYLVWLYFNDGIKIPPAYLILFSWMTFTLMSARGAIRLFFMITPFICFSAGYFTVNMFNYVKKAKDDLLRMILWVLIILIIIGALTSFDSFYKSTASQAKYTGPSANLQWQNAMKWVRENTVEGSIFVHWWDYGYWVEYLGKRPVVTDGGHAVGYWDHLIGRYLLTTPEPATALSFMKTHDVSYLLIDQTDLRKYSAYSRIGSGSEGEDRYGWLPIMISDPSQTTEIANGTIRIYQGGSTLDEDIIFDSGDGNQIFLPAGVAGIGAIIIETVDGGSIGTLSQPKGVFVYNGNQIELPIRYAYLNDQFVDFEQGLDAIISIIPHVYDSPQGTQIDALGGLIYLSPRVSKSLFAQLFLLNDPQNKYETLELVYSEPDPIIKSMKQQGVPINDFVIYQGFRGPIKIWKVDYPENTLEREEFLRRSGEYAEFDNLQFTK